MRLVLNGGAVQLHLPGSPLSSACAIPPKKPKPKIGRTGASASELQSLLALLPMLRWGSAPLKELLSISLDSKPKDAAQSKPLPKKREVPPAAANGWVEQKPKKTNQKKDVPKYVLLPEGFSGKVVASTAELSAQEPTVCLASMSEARAALAELKSSKPMAVLAPANIDSKGKEVSVLVEDASGKKQSRVRFLFQLGTGEITYSSSLPRGQEVRGNCKKVVLQLSQEHTVKEAWEASLKEPQQAAKRWLLHRAQIAEVLFVHKPTLRDGRLQIVVGLPAASEALALKKSGVDGVLTRHFYETESDSTRFKTVPLPLSVDRVAALRIAAANEDKVHGVVPTKLGWGLRVQTRDFEEILQIVQPAEEQARFLGKDWEVSGIPLDWTSQDVIAFLQGWDIRVRPGDKRRNAFRNTWTVRSSQEPPQDSLIHPTLPVTALIREKQSKPLQNGRNVSVWKPHQNAAPVAFPETWGSKGKGKGSQTKAVPVSCSVASTGGAASAPPPVPATSAPAPVFAAADAGDPQPDISAQLAGIAALLVSLQAQLSPLQKNVGTLLAHTGVVGEPMEAKTVPPSASSDEDMLEREAEEAAASGKSKEAAAMQEKLRQMRTSRSTHLVRR